MIGPFDTNWVASQVQEVMASLLAATRPQGHQLRVLGGMALGAFSAIEAAGVSPDMVWTMRTDEPVLGCGERAQRSEPPYLLRERVRKWQIRTALTANMMALKGFDVPRRSCSRS